MQSLAATLREIGPPSVDRDLTRIKPAAVANF
jgi:hypothetical protein